MYNKLQKKCDINKILLKREKYGEKFYATFIHNVVIMLNTKSNIPFFLVNMLLHFF